MDQGRRQPQQNWKLQTLSGRPAAGRVWNARVLLRELRERHYGGGYTILTIGCATTRLGAIGRRTALRDRARQAAQVTGHLGSLTENGNRHPLWGFTMTLGYSRRIMAEAVPTPKLAPVTDARAGIEQWKECRRILYDRMERSGRAPDGARRDHLELHVSRLRTLLGFTPRLCRHTRADQGKVESGVSTSDATSLRTPRSEPAQSGGAQCRVAPRVCEVVQSADSRTTHEQVLLRWTATVRHAIVHGRAPYPSPMTSRAKSARDAYVSWQASRYSVPWIYAGKEVTVHEQADQVEVRSGGHRIALHRRATTQHSSESRCASITKAFAHQSAFRQNARSHSARRTRRGESPASRLRSGAMEACDDYNDRTLRTSSKP